MYESPITLITSQMIQNVEKDTENEVFKAIFKVGVNVNKEELIRALRYDREQYSKGYSDGIKQFAERLKEKATSTFYEERKYVDTEDIDNLVKEMVGE